MFRQAKDEVQVCLIQSFDILAHTDNGESKNKLTITKILIKTEEHRQQQQQQGKPNARKTQPGKSLYDKKKTER